MMVTTLTAFKAEELVTSLSRTLKLTKARVVYVMISVTSVDTMVTSSIAINSQLMMR